MAGSVEVALPAIVRAWRRGGGGAVNLQFRASGPTAAAEQATDEAVARANAVHEQRIDGVNGAGAQTASMPGGSLIQIGFCESESALRSFVTMVATTLEELGAAGSLVVPRSQDTVFDREAISCLAAVASIPIDRQSVATDIHGGRGTPWWYGSGEATAGLLSAVSRWCGELPEVYLSQDGVQVRIRPEDAEALTAAALRGRSIPMLSGASGTTRLRRAAFDRMGLLSLFSVDTTRTPLWEAQDLTELLPGIASFVEHAAIRRAPAPYSSWTDVVAFRPPLPPYGGPGMTDTAVLRRVRHLADRRVLDAYGVQVLTDAHVAHVHDLSAWEVSPLSGGRHLVQARDLARWFEGSTPDPATLDRARRDFGEVILSPDVVAEEPAPPW